MNKKLRKFLKFVLTVTLSITCWEICKKQVNYINNSRTYNAIQEQKNTYNNMTDYLYDKDYDWITLSETSIDYPLMSASDNQYYLTHNYLGENDIGGAIYYDAADEPYSGSITIIYGHSMRNGTMFNNLHSFPKDHERFKNSKLEIYKKEEKKVYVPIGYAVYTNEESFHRAVDKMSTSQAMSYIEGNSDYFIKGINYADTAHIIGLVTCDYSIYDGRLIVFYISE